jgi:hypothetical protein
MQHSNPALRSTSSGSRPGRFAFIIGGMKCGTTSLFEILSQHPEICPSREKEPNYFIKDQADSSSNDYLALWDWRENTNTIALESSVAYTKAPFIPDVPERISRAKLGDYRFIYMLRNPLSRIESQVRHGLFAGWGQSLDTGISEDLLDFSRYAMQMDQYLNYFSKDQILPVTLEEFKIDPHAVLTRICAFLDIDEKFQFLKAEEPRNSGDFFESSPIIARISQGEIGQFIARRILPPSLKKWLRGYLTKRGNRKQNSSNLGRWKLKPEERTLILTSLKDDLKRLESEFAIDTRKYWHIPKEFLD